MKRRSASPSLTASVGHLCHPPECTPRPIRWSAHPPAERRLAVGHGDAAQTLLGAALSDCGAPTPHVHPRVPETPGGLNRQIRDGSFSVFGVSSHLPRPRMRLIPKNTTPATTSTPKTIPSHGGPSGPPPGAASSTARISLLLSLTRFAPPAGREGHSPRTPAYMQRARPPRRQAPGWVTPSSLTLIHPCEARPGEHVG